jgi:hypothetical protein
MEKFTGAFSHPHLGTEAELQKRLLSPGAGWEGSGSCLPASLSSPAAFVCVCVWLLGFELKVGLHLKPLYQPFCCDGFFFKVGSHELFA